MAERNDIIKEIDRYYTDKVQQHGATPQGVDWNGEESQHLRFETLLKIVSDSTNPFTLLDYGCGYGSLYEYMQVRYKQFHYTGYDISDAMIDAAKSKHTVGPVDWITKIDGTLFDYIVASGIFNVRLQHSETAWWDYVVKELDWMHDHAVNGFAFNMLTSYSDKDRMRDYLYYADPSRIFEHCKTKYSKFVALLHDYPLYEFTILVRKA